MKSHTVREGIVFLKFWLDVSRPEQLRRMLAREKDPLKQWKLSTIDVEGLGKWDEYCDAEHRVRQLVKQGRLSERGLDPLEPTSYVQVYKAQDGEVWRLATPDHAFRGYLKCTPPADKRAASGFITIRTD